MEINSKTTFLQGPTLYLRGIELADARTIAIWHPSPFPLPLDLAEERLKREVLDETREKIVRLLICRNSDDQTVGSLFYQANDAVNGWFAIGVDPRLAAERGAITAEALARVVPWLLVERDLVSLHFETEQPDSVVREAITTAGMHFAYRLREAIWRDGERHDQFVFEVLHPAWLQRLEAPAFAVEGDPPQPVRSPAPMVWRGRSGPPPDGAILVGNRIFLRAVEPADAEEMARWSGRETESFHKQGRTLRSPLQWATATRALAEASPPEWIRFAIVDRDSGQVIGGNGVAGIDWISRTAETETEIVQPAFRGDGYGTEAKHLLLEYAFQRLGLHAVRSYAWEFNERSCSALRKQGYRDAGRINWTGIKNGTFADDRVFDLLATEWRAARR